MEESECHQILNEWIVKIKRNIYAKNIKTENLDELQDYKSELVELDRRIRKAIETENFTDIEDLEFPKELIGCLTTNMNIRSEVLDSINQSFTVNQFNQSPKHEEELNNM